MILHIDMDAFYASIEIRDDPRLRGKPVVVGGSPIGRGVISAASYEARKYGVHSAMPASQAARLCPQLVFVRGRMEHYAAISKQIRSIFYRFTSLVEPLALDEAFLDVSGSERLFGTAEEIAKQIKETIRNETRLVASAGVAENKFLAKVASDLDKPDGLVVVPEGTGQEFMAPLPIQRIWGVGKKTAEKFLKLGIKTVGQLRQLDLETLKQVFGLHGEHFWKLSRGLDARPVVSDRDAKTISHETTFRTDVEQLEVLDAWVIELADQVARRMRRYEITGKTVRLKLRYSDFRTVTRAVTLASATHATREVSVAARELLKGLMDSEGIQDGVRLIGVGMSHLRSGTAQQLNLFDCDERERDSRVDSATDEIKEKFGNFAIQPASNLEHKIRHRPDPRVKE